MTSTSIPVVPAEPTEPVRRAVMVQRWADLVYLHWRYDPAVVQALLPDGLEVDVADGSAWVGLIPFRMEGLGLPHLAPLPLVGTFPEVNVRTYVIRNGRRAVWFFSLDVDRILPVVGARAGFHLPYCVARASHTRAGDILTTSVERRWPRPPHGTGTTSIAVRDLGPDLTDDPLDRFLTARWGLYASTRRGGFATHRSTIRPGRCVTPNCCTSTTDSSPQPACRSPRVRRECAGRPAWMCASASPPGRRPSVGQAAGRRTSVTGSVMVTSVKSTEPPSRGWA
jgi:hypothetical protein